MPELSQSALPLDRVIEELEGFVAAWALAHPLCPAHVDCTTAVMLKILDGKCKMKAQERVVMGLLYRQVRHLTGERLSADLHPLIERARAGLDDALRESIYARRVLAETMISRPVMKQFKAMIREQGLFAMFEHEGEEDE